MNLVDATLLTRDVARERDGVGPSAVVPASVDSLGRAAQLLGVDRDTLRTDPAANIRGGAALLASMQRSLNLPVGTGTDPGQWYASVAAASGSPDAPSAADFADAAYTVVTQGAARTTTDGQTVYLAARVTTPLRVQLDRLRLANPPWDPKLECPATVRCESFPAPYEQYGPAMPTTATTTSPTGPRPTEIDYIVIHDTEGYWDATLKLVQDPTYVAGTTRALVGRAHRPARDRQGRRLARRQLVREHALDRHRARGLRARARPGTPSALPQLGARWCATSPTKYNIPLDRAHIIGHDQVPGTAPRPSPACTGTRARTGTGSTTSSCSARRCKRDRPGPAATSSRIMPGFADQPAACDRLRTRTACQPQGTNFVYLHRARTTPPAGERLGLHPDGTAGDDRRLRHRCRARRVRSTSSPTAPGTGPPSGGSAQKAWFKNPAVNRRPSR